MPTLAELMASLGAVQAAGMGQTGALLTQTAEQERRDIEQAYIDLERQQREKEEAARKREKKRGRGRLLGTVVGTILGGGTPIGTAIGAGLGSLVGQAATGREKLGAVSAPLAKGLFFKTGREKLTSNVEDINSMLASAEERYGEAVWSSALIDALSGYGMAKAGSGLTDLAGAVKETGLGAIPEYAKSFIPGVSPFKPSAEALLSASEYAKSLGGDQGFESADVGGLGFLGGRRVSSPLSQMAAGFIPRRYKLDPFGRGQGQAIYPLLEVTG